MGDEGEKTCPLCAEEMDLTDQQLRPCRCGYEICVWCWHHIMDMAEKDETDGRCPACRLPYDKEKIVGTAASCERLVAGINMEKKQKSQKAKTKTSENRKQLSSVRVIQRNLVYIVGLPLSLADEDLLQGKEYFAQYGKVLKVSISRTSAGTIQQFANSTCSVYITYTKEEEAVRCIQSVHGFILDDRPLRACFGTTKYCHAWLRNMPCSNPDCLYLHEIGSQEDSFTKDEIISAYTRSRVQQITGCTNNMQRLSGNALPPPADDYCSDSFPVIGKPVVNNSSNNSTNSVRGSPPTSSSDRSGALPPAASWGSRTSNGHASAGNPPFSNEPMKQKAEVINGPPMLSTPVSSSTQASTLPSVGRKKLMLDGDVHASKTRSKLDMLGTSKHHGGTNSHTHTSEVSSAPSSSSALKLASQSFSQPASNSKIGADNFMLNPALNGDEQPSCPANDEGGRSIADETNKQLCNNISLMSIDNGLEDGHSDVVKPNGLCLDNFLSSGSKGLQCFDLAKLKERSTPVTAASAATAIDSVTYSGDEFDWKSDQVPAMQNLTSETEDDFDNQRLRDAIVVSQATMPAASPLHYLSHLNGHLLQQHLDATTAVAYGKNPPDVNRMPVEGLASNVSGGSVASNGFLDNFVGLASGFDNFSSPVNVAHGNQIRRFEGAPPNVDSQPVVDIGESSIISNILDLDLWDESLTSPQNLAKLLGEADKQECSVNMASPWKGQISNQSRFSFARQEESRNQFNFESPHNSIDQLPKNHAGGPIFAESRGLYLDRFGTGVGLPQVSRSQISAPPGFAAPSRPPPPGFTLHERSDQTFDINSGNHLLESSAFLRNNYQAPSPGSLSTSNDIEFMDPAILAVGKGRLPNSHNNSSIDMRPSFPSHPSFEDESRLLMQRSLSSHQNLGYNDVRDSFSPLHDGYGYSSRHIDQSQVNNLSPFSQFSHQQTRNTVMSNGHWDNWNEIPAVNDSIADQLRNDRLGFNKFGMTNSGDLYNTSFRM